MCERCAELEEQVMQLKALLGADITPPEMGMSVHEWRLYRVIKARGAVTKRYLEDLLIAAFDRDIHPKTLHVYICRMNKKLRAHGQPTIRNKWGWGYIMDPEHGHSDRSAAA